MSNRANEATDRMSPRKIKAAMREFCDLVTKPREEIKESAWLVARGKVVAILESDVEVPAEVFAEISADARKAAIKGLLLVVSEAMEG